MSNVLIGIIGVILFIGLALAGALLLGSQFRDQKHDTMVAAVQERFSQTLAASRLYRIDNGANLVSYTPIDATHPLVTQGYLKTPPQLPQAAAFSDTFISTMQSSQTTVDNSGTNSDMLLFYIGQPAHSGAQQICLRLHQRNGGSGNWPTIGISDAHSLGMTTWPVGCFQRGAGGNLWGYAGTF